MTYSIVPIRLSLLSAAIAGVLIAPAVQAQSSPTAPMTAPMTAPTAAPTTAPTTAPLSVSPVHPLNLNIQDSAAQAGNLNRAKNLARQTAEKANGGLSRYQAESAMHGFAAEAPFVDNGNGSYTFTFLGGRPGFTAPTVQSVVTVNTTDWTTHLDYNGAIRSATVAPGSTAAPASTTAPATVAP
jgi:hypothetical protein